MSDDDVELERLKAKRLAEMQKNISSKKEPETSPDHPVEEKPSEDPRDLLIKKIRIQRIRSLN